MTVAKRQVNRELSLSQDIIVSIGNSSLDENDQFWWSNKEAFMGRG